MLKHSLTLRLDEVSRRYRRIRRRVALTAVWCLAAGIGAALLLIGHASIASAVILLALAACLAALLWAVAQRPAKDFAWIARRIEDRHPELNSLLVSAVEMQPLYGHNGFGFLQESVLRDAIRGSHGGRWSDVAPAWKARGAQLIQLAAFAVMLAVASLLIQRANYAPASVNPLVDARPPVLAAGDVQVEPGDAEIERGSSLLVLARFSTNVPSEAELVIESPTRGELRQPMSRGLDDPVFGARVAEVNEEVEYAVAYTSGETRRYRLTVFEYPALLSADARLAYPSYTGQAEALVQDTRRITAVAGTEVTLECHLNKPVKMAWLQGEGGAKIELAADSSNVKLVRASWTLRESGRWKLHLVDADGRLCKDPAEFRFRATENRPPDLKFVFPSRDIEASPLEEIDIEATAIDDFGLPKVGLSYTLANGEPKEELLLENGAGKLPQTVKYKVDLEALGAKPDELLSYFLWAEDIDETGQPRRVYSDMFFAEVRPFEEIYRQGEQPSEGEMAGGQQGQMGGGQGQATSELVELQKEIIGAEWKLIRRESPKLTDAYKADTDLLLESQQAALELTAAAEEQLPSPELAADLEDVRASMAQAIEHLTGAQQTPSVETHRQALAAEQAAYQGLLRLRAKEFRVIRGQQQQQQQGGGGGGGGGGNRSQRQLQQLELKNDRNRYETQRSAQAAGGEEQREIRQTQNRLRELARRQEDVNKQMRELQSALERAQTEEEREEAERKLKRLRDEQQQLLRDVDELQDRLEQSENREQMAPAQAQLEETRENVRRATEALEEGRVSQALAEGARAEQELRELRDDFRRAAANQFSEEMREIREEARNIDQTQQELSERMERMEDARATSLRDEDSRAGIERGLEEQQANLDGLYERMKETVEESEIPEPLLSRQLYDTLRTAQQQQVGERLDRTRQLLEAGFPDEARQEAAPAREALSNLRQGVEQAAESVLGDEAEALRQARDQLDELSRQLDEEVARNENPEGDGTEQEAAQTPGQRSGEAPEREGEGEGEEPGEGEQRQGQDGQDSQDEDGREGGEGGERENGEERESSGQGGQNQGAQRSPNEQRQEGSDGQQQASGQSEGGEQSLAAGDERAPAQAGRGERSSDGQENPQSRGGQGLRGADVENRDGDARRGGARQGAPIDDLFGPVGGVDGPFEERVLTGEDFLEWSDRLRDVEEMLEDPDLRFEAARIRERAREIRAEFKRHSAEPNWPIVRETIAAPLTALRDRVSEELRRKQKQDSLAPIDRDPTPSQFSDRVRRYYERLGSGSRSGSEEGRPSRATNDGGAGP